MVEEFRMRGGTDSLKEETAGSLGGRKPKSEIGGVFAIVVLYKTHPRDSVTLQTLLRAADWIEKQPIRLAISIHDNTPEGQEPGPLPADIRYTAAKRNPGLAIAYNTAAAAASEEGYEWLLTLDQDTELPEDFLEVMFRETEIYEKERRVGAVVPHIFDQGRHISPFRFVCGFWPIVLPPSFDGIAPQYSSAINSCTFLRLSALEKIGGYDRRFPINNSDSSLFVRLDAAGFRIAVAGELRVQHELAIMNRQDRMSLERYQQVLDDERAFWDFHMGFLGRVERAVRLLGRVFKDLIERRNAEFRARSLAEVWYRLVTRRRRRIERWKKSSVQTVEIPPIKGSIK